YLFAGFFIVFALIGGVTVWAATQQISGAVIATGRVVVATNLRKVQHPTGGVVSEIKVKNGDRVHEGQLLMRLDETITRANLRVVVKQINELTMRAARLEAERDGLESVGVPDSLLKDHTHEVKRIVSGELNLFRSRRETRAKQKAQLRERIAQHVQEISGIDGQVKAKATEIQLIDEELQGLETLEAQQLITTNRMVSMRRQAARLEGERGQLVASVARIRGQIAEVELQILGIEQEEQTKIVNELRQIESKLSEFVERRIAAEDQLKRIDIRAPSAGIVHQLAVHTVGGVINSAEPVMRLVPLGDKLVIEARVAPQNIDSIYVDQPARVRFSAFNQRTTPELDGHVTRIGADLTRDEITGETFFSVRIEFSEDEVARLGENKLVPGIPADVQIHTGDRTALSYLIKPLQDQLSKAFRER
ncbi:MAG: HlyD family type I secretion periplasmic adaptor subunit, partial [Alphaproteobacteria bacterium]|nr:HlyD family type I secretion periplasmic adaptor subunit [Alphaproteobacteria bacterium]